MQNAIHNPRTGQRMVFVTDEPDLLEIETLNPPSDEREPEHVHPRQESGARVTAGALMFEVDGVERLVRAGESIEIPANTPHRFWNEGGEDAHALQWFRPSLKTRSFFEAFFALAEDGKLDDKGMPSLMQVAVMIPEFGDEIRPTRPPWPVQRAAAAVLAPVARRRGYRGMYKSPNAKSTEGEQMDEVPTRNHAEAHAKAVVDGDMDSVLNDLVPDIRDEGKQIAQKLPQPTTDAEIKKLDMHDDHAIAEILYSNEEESLRLRTRWEEHDGRPMIVEVNEVE